MAASNSADRIPAAKPPEPLPQWQGEPPTKAPDPIDALPPDEQKSLRAAIEETQHIIWPLDERLAGLPINRGTTHHATNPSQNLQARFLENGGVRLQSSSTDSKWQATLRMRGAAASAWQDSTTRIQRDHGTLTEWYENRTAGFEHGFTLRSRPDGTPSGSPAIVRMTLDELRADADPARSGDLVFSDPVSGHAVLGYRNLKVWDATGTPLPANMRPTGEGFLIAVNDTQATYPITIDPLIVSLDQEIIDHPDRSGALFGLSVAIEGNTAVIGAPFDPSNGENRGSVYIFKRTGTTWALSQQIVQSFNNLVHLGRAVTISGDVMVAGAVLFRDNFQETFYDSILIYRRNSEGTWVLEKRTSPDIIDTSSFLIGSPITQNRPMMSLAIQGNVIVMGSASHRAAYVLRYVNNDWALDITLTAPSGASSLLFGYAVAISDGTIAVAAPDYQNTPNVLGKIYIYRKTGNLWPDPVEIAPTGTASGDRFGCAIAMSGTRLVVGANGKDFSSLTTDIGCVHTFDLVGTTWVQRPVLLSPDPGPFALFGSSLALEGNTLVVGSVLDPGNDANEGSATVFTSSGNTWAVQQHIRLFSGVTDCTIALSGNTLITGIYLFYDFMSSRGRADLFTRSGSTWSLQQTVQGTPSGNGAAGAQFGTSVAVQGNLAVVGSPLGNTGSVAATGFATVYERTGSVWRRRGLARLIPGDYPPNGRFGTSVAISGTTIVVGADGVSSSNGAVYVHTPSGGAPAFLYSQQILLRTSPTAGERLGFSVAIDGDRIVAGAPVSAAAGPNTSGCAVIFTRGTNGTWTQTRQLQAQRFGSFFSVESDASAGSRFGLSVDITGNKILVGAPHTDLVSPARLDAGRAYIYTFDPATSVWNFGGTFDAGTDGVAGDWLGYSVSVNDDRVVLGAPGGVAGLWSGTVVGNGRGKVFIFRPGFIFWDREAIVTASSPVSSDGHLFGWSVSMDGDRLAIGTPQKATGFGKVYLFRRSNTTWAQQQQFVFPQSQLYSNFGGSVSLDGDTLFIGGSLQDTLSRIDAGSVYVYRITDPDAITPTLSITRTGSTAVLTWQSTVGWKLYRSPTLLGGSWEAVTVATDGTHTHPITPGQPRMFFRLQKP